MLELTIKFNDDNPVFRTEADHDFIARSLGEIAEYVIRGDVGGKIVVDGTLSYQWELTDPEYMVHKVDDLVETLEYIKGCGSRSDAHEAASEALTDYAS